MFKKQPGVHATAFVEIAQLDLKYQTLKLLLTFGLSCFRICTYDQKKKKKRLVLKETDYFLCNMLPQSSYSLFLPDLTAIQMHWFCCTLNQKYDLCLETPLKNIFFCQFSVTAYNNKRDYWTFKVSMFSHLPEFTYCSCRVQIRNQILKDSDLSP